MQHYYSSSLCKILVLCTTSNTLLAIESTTHMHMFFVEFLITIEHTMGARNIIYYQKYLIIYLFSFNAPQPKGSIENKMHHSLNQLAARVVNKEITLEQANVKGKPKYRSLI